ncbi:MAG: hypothetical protein V2I33_21925 [Kangiellaceae bacterium]|nr:hypothetical protein [Kangiellaceae bacterium]
MPSKVPSAVGASAFKLGGLLGLSPDKPQQPSISSRRDLSAQESTRKASTRIGYKFATPRTAIGVHVIEKLEGMIPDYQIGLSHLSTTKIYNTSRTIKNMLGSIYTRKRGKGAEEVV